MMSRVHGSVILRNIYLDDDANDHGFIGDIRVLTVKIQERLTYLKFLQQRNAHAFQYRIVSS